jgi:hypothetical protein
MEKRSARPPLSATGSLDPSDLEECPSDPYSVSTSSDPESGHDDLVDCCFAIFPDEVEPGHRARPVAIFDTLEDAMDWGQQRFKGGAFRLRFERFVLLPNDVETAPRENVA